MQRFHFIRSFLAHQRGNVFMIVAGGLALIVGVGGAAIDLGREQLVHNKLQQATDAAGLAYQSLDTTGMTAAAATAAQKDAAKRYYALNFPDTYMSVARPSLNVTAGNEVTISTGAVEIQTLFVSALGYPTLTTSATTVVANATSVTPQGYDLVFAIDNSGSMNTNDVGNSGSLPVPASLQPAVLQAASNTCYQLFINRGYSVSGSQSSCVVGGTTVNADTMGLNGFTRINAVRSAANTIATQLLEPNTAGSQVAVVGWSEAIVFPPPPTTPTLSGDYSTVYSELLSLYALGATNSTLGLQEAVNLSSNFNPKHVHAVVLLTDGTNTAAGPLHVNPASTFEGVSDNYSCDGLCDPTHGDNFCSGNNYCSATNSASLAVCDQLKNSGTLIYTIAFGGDVLGSTVVANFLSSCATQNSDGTSNEGSYFFVAPDAATLDKAFATILTSLKKTRISQ